MTDKLAAARSFLSEYPQQVQDVALALRSVIRSVIPQADEMVDPPGRCIGYGIGTGYKGLICTIIVSKSGVKLGMVGGADLPDPHGLLEGSGKKHKYVVIGSLTDAKRPGVKELIEAGTDAKLKRKDIRLRLTGAPRNWLLTGTHGSTSLICSQVLGSDKNHILLCILPSHMDIIEKKRCMRRF